MNICLGKIYYFLSKSLLHKNFAQTDLGELYQSIPFESFSETIPAPAFAKNSLGRKPWFDVKGAIGLLILKHYTGLSDALLIERINTDWAMQLFCGIQLKPGQQIKNPIFQASGELISANIWI